jgi:ketosteroid isomerase-like protein
MALTEKRFEAWLAQYGKAFEAQNATAFSALFTEKALHYRTPFEEPKKGRGEIAAAFAAAVGRQRDIDFGARVLYVNAELGAAHWSAAFTRTNSGRRVHIDGVLGARFDATGKVVSLREWWHSDER